MIQVRPDRAITPEKLREYVFSWVVDELSAAGVDICGLGLSRVKTGATWIIRGIQLCVLQAGTCTDDEGNTSFDVRWNPERN